MAAETLNFGPEWWVAQALAHGKKLGQWGWATWTFVSLFPFCACSRLRALSGGGNVASPPPSPAMPKYKLADYRYGREEMLALYVKENKVRFPSPFALSVSCP
ncbi:PERQ amino acid-rich with GYF domain-containing protein 2 [Cricetulus griseus]|uniref:PERQ amino acid-rich with GYF domain-containing protein 2 n=1 Tax=Cricetulus griseus TaxID=10029 RepID=G3I670_CRIGR|nr:PERQ amino acid-rich with GYF domain-containing protein 2 [Cricetulus griseus]